MDRSDWWEAFRTIAAVVVIIAIVYMSRTCNTRPNCPDDPAYRYDPKTGTCVDLGQALRDAYAKRSREQYLADRADMLSEKAQDAYYADLLQQEFEHYLTDDRDP